VEPAPGTRPSEWSWAAPAAASSPPDPHSAMLSISICLALAPLASPTQLPAAQEPGRLRHVVADGRHELRGPEGELVHATTAVLVDLRELQLPGEAGFVTLWQEERGGERRAHYLVEREDRGRARVRETDYTIHLKRERFDPLERDPLAAEAGLGESGELHLVQFACPPLAELRADLESRGAEVLSFLPMHTRIVRMDAELAAEVAQLPYVRWVGPYRADYRLEAELLDGLAAGELAPLTHCHVQVFEEGPRQKTVVARRIAELGGQVVTQYPEGFRLDALLTPEQLLAVAAFDEVLFVDRYQAPEEDLNRVRDVGGANALESLEGFSGQGVRGEVMDGNVRQTHAGFQHDPLIIHGALGGSTDHGTKTTGIVFGDGTGQPSARGLLPNGQGIFADYGFLGNRYAHTAQLLAAPYFAVFQSNSWGSGTTTAYNSTSNQMDNILFDMDITIIQSQSNTGNQLSRPQAWAKNIISVGALYHRNTASLVDDDWAGGASIGPAADGRVKPDLCFWYDSIWTTDDEHDTDYNTSFCCTSAATPCVAGYVGLVQQMWSEGVFGFTPAGNTVFERRAKASTVRALLVNSATQYDFSGTGHDRTRTHQGWGLPDVETLHDNRESMLIVNESDVLAEGASVLYEVTVQPGQHDLKATLVYMDPPGTTSASQHRINDLSLRVTAPDATVYWGNNGLLAGNWSTSGGSSNTIDVIENVFVQNAQAGEWTVEVFADEVNQDGHVETGALDADFALVVSGISPLPFCVLPTTHCTGKLNSVGTVPEIGWQGDARVSDNDFQITVALAVPQKSALIFWGDDPATIPFQGATLCVQGPHTRGQVLTTGPLGGATWNVDLSGKTVGTSENYQVWYRDPGDPAGFGTGLSDGMTVTYCE